MTKTAGQAVVDALVAAGVDHAFTVPGESFLGILAALRDDERIRLVATRHEGGAGFMAEAYGKVTRRPALCLATRAVGGANLAIGIHTAQQDSTPLVGILGQVPTSFRYREAFQEADLVAMFSPLTKWAMDVTDAGRAAELTYQAARTALSGRPGPAVLVFPEDILEREVEAREWPPVDVAGPLPDPAGVKAVVDLVRGARRPAMLVGGGVLAAGAVDAAVAFAEHEHLPVLTSWRRPDAFPNDHELYLGQTGLSSPPSVAERLREADVVLVVGCRLSEITTFGYTVPGPRARWAHVDLEPHGQVGTSVAAVRLYSDAAAFFAAARDAVAVSPVEVNPTRQTETAADRARWVGQTTPGTGQAASGFADQQAVAGHLRRLLPHGSIVVTDAGNFSGWGARYLRWNSPGTFLGPTSGAMGYAVPAAIGAKLARPAAPVVALAGDGGFLMTASDIETSVREDAPFVAVVFNNSQYGTIRMHQEAHFPGGAAGTRLGAVDAAALTEALGGRGYRVDDADDFPEAFRAALSAGVTATIDVRTDPDQLSVGQDAAGAIPPTRL